MERGKEKEKKAHCVLYIKGGKEEEEKEKEEEAWLVATSVGRAWPQDKGEKN